MWLPTFADPDYELEAGPDLAHGADLDVDEAHGERDFADHVFGDIGRHLRRTLWPRDPDIAVRRERLAQVLQVPDELRAFRDKDVHGFEGRLRLAYDGRAFR